MLQLTNFNKKVTIVLGDNMKSKEKQKRYTKATLKSIIYSAFATIILFDIVIFYNLYFSRNETYAIDKIQEAGAIQISSNAQLQFSNAENVDIDSIIQENTGTSTSEEFHQEINVLEYLTQYVTNDQLAKGESYVIQEGVKGTQKITYKKIYENGEVIGEEQVSAVVEKPAFNKVVEIGTGAKTTSYTVKVGDIVYVTSDELTVRLEPNEDSEKVTKLKKDDALEIVKIQNEWYYISCNQTKGWVKKEATKYILKQEPKQEDSTVITNQTNAKSKNELLAGLDFNMSLNKPSGLTLEQFQKVLTDSRDVNNIFRDNAQYFYYIESQYQINGIFVASIGIHESAWGTSKIALNKKNLFGYGAYDSNPYNGAYQFSNYSECIDLIARVLVKYYLNPKGTSIYSGETAQGTYYSSPTLTGVNQKYATDKNWANAVYSYMKYLYNKL